ncbi:MAG: hypothetical protein KGD63_11090 [Candidatus Lokiarchaeota archaeon]|nr:hypothetical protein [Candidatus Lokiarchaeota archaeon]
MHIEKISQEKGTLLRKNGPTILKISINKELLNKIYLINNIEFLTENISLKKLEIAPNHYYMIINKSNSPLEIDYNLDISNHEIVYDPYKYEDSKKEDINPQKFMEEHNIPSGYIDFLSKWYSIKFTYLDYNLIYIKSNLGISIQTHKKRSEQWEILEGKPIIINGNKVHYFVESGTFFEHTFGTYHTIINPNKNDEFTVLKENWSGEFDEEDIERVFNPNSFYSK